MQTMCFSKEIEAKWKAFMDNKNINVINEVPSQLPANTKLINIPDPKYIQMNKYAKKYKCNCQHHNSCPIVFIKRISTNIKPYCKSCNTYVY